MEDMIKISDMTTVDKLIAFAVIVIRFDLFKGNPEFVRCESFAPGSKTTLELVTQLTNIGVINEVTKDNNADDVINFGFDALGHYNLSTEEMDKIFAELEILLNNEHIDIITDSLSLIDSIRLSECEIYLEHQMRNRELPFKIGVKTREVLSEAISHYSVAQCFNLIYRSAAQSESFYESSDISKRHAANTVVTKIQRNTIRAISNDWVITPFDRPRSNPLTIMSDILDAIFFEGEDYIFNGKF